MRSASLASVGHCLLSAPWERSAHSARGACGQRETPARGGSILRMRRDATARCRKRRESRTRGRATINSWRGGGGVGGLARVAVQAGMRALPVECSAARVRTHAYSVAGGDARNKETGGSGWWFLLAANSRPRTIPRIKMRSIAGCTPVARMPCLHGVRLHIHPGALLRHARLCCGAARPGWAPQAVVIALPAAWVPGSSTLGAPARCGWQPTPPLPTELRCVGGAWRALLRNASDAWARG